MTAEDALAALAPGFAAPEDATALVAGALARRDRWARRGGKPCPSCGEAKPLSAFGPDLSRPDGLAHRCRSCDAARRRAARAAKKAAAA